MPKPNTKPNPTTPKNQQEHGTANSPHPELAALAALVATPPEPQGCIEATHFLQGLFKDFHDQVHKYQSLTAQLMSVEARVELAEKTMCLMRDHLAMSIKKTDSATPHDWDKTLKSVRFVGSRLVDACLVVLRKHKKMTPEEIRDALNHGMFRFRTASPLREIHAALLRQESVKRVGTTWMWLGEQESMRLHVLMKHTDPDAASGQEETDMTA